MRCARHPEAETGLTCGRCETPVCPKCLMMTDVGVRCQTCVPKRSPLLEQVGPRYLAQGLGASVGAGALLGAIWGVLLPPQLGGLGIFSLAVAAIVGYLVAQAVSRAANLRRGRLLQLVAVLGVAVAYFTRSWVGEQALFVAGDTAGYVAALLAAVVAFLSLR
ncbi:MAG: hypothetical protein ACE5KW_01460 [Dehalococcoidia bacterium]